MLDILIFIDSKWQRLRLAPNAEFAITKQIAGLTDLETRNTSFSTRFQVSVLGNEVLFDYLSTNGNTSNVPYKAIDARVIYDGLPLAQDLVLKVSGRKSSYYEATLQGKSKDWITLMKEEMLPDLMQGELNIVDFSNPSYIAVANLLRTKYCYQNFFLNTDPPIGGDVLYADTVYLTVPYEWILSTLIGKYFSNIEGDIMTEEDVLESVVHCLATRNPQWQDSEVCEMEFDGLFEVTIDKYGPTYSVTKNPKNFINIYYLPFQGGYYVNSYRPTANRTVEVTIEYDFTASNVVGTFKLMLLQKIGTDTLLVNSEAYVVAETDAISNGRMVGKTTQTFTVSKGRELLLIFWNLGGSFSADINVTTLKMTVKPIAQALYGDSEIDSALMLPNISTWDFFTDFVKRYGLIWNASGDTIRFEKLDDVFKKAVGSEDYTQRLMSNPDESYSFGNYAKKNKFIGASEVDEAEIVFDNDYLQEMKDVVKLEQLFFENREAGQFVNPKPIGRVQGEIHEIQETPLTDSSSKQTLLLNHFDKLIIGRVQSINTNTAINFRLAEDNSDTGFTLASGQFVYYSNGVSINYYVDNYYRHFMKSLERPFVINVNIHFDPISFNELDFFTLKYLSQYQAYFYLVKAENFTGNNPVKCTFLKVKTQ